MRARSICQQPGCPEFATYRGWCSTHRVRYRPSSAWRERGRAMARDEWRCADCGLPATVAHHVYPRRKGGSDDASNLVALCDHCHDLREHPWKR